jgi:hypothetical protein
MRGWQSCNFQSPVEALDVVELPMPLTVATVPTPAVSDAEAPTLI